MPYQSKITSQHLQTGYFLHNNYIIENILGEGGFGITYSGFCQKTNQQVAIKEYKRVDKGLQRFLNEASILKEFSDLQNIVSVLDVFEENGTAYLVMEYIDGITLNQYITENGVLSLNELIPLVKPLLQELLLIHDTGIIHRDISPDNIMVGIDNKFHLIDFGAANISNPNESKTMTVILKSGYAPPEQYLSDGKIGPWTDIYALCATMYKALTGITPLESIHRIQEDNLEPLHTIFPSSDNAAWQLAAIEKGMSLKIADRFRNTNLLLQALTTKPPIEENETLYNIPANKIMKHTVTKLNKPKFRKRNIAFFFLLCLILIGSIVWKMEWFKPNQKDNPKNEVNKKPDVTIDTRGESTSSKIQPVTEENAILTMINTVGTSFESAKTALQQLDPSINIQTLEEYSNQYPVGIIITQSIAENTQFTKGQITGITLTVSLGSEPATQAPAKTNNTNKKKENSTIKKGKYTKLNLD